MALVCNPVDKNGEGIPDPDAHLACFKIFGDPSQPFQQVSVGVEDQFGDRTIELVKPRLLCAPANNRVLSP